MEKLKYRIRFVRFIKRKGQLTGAALPTDVATNLAKDVFFNKFFPFFKEILGYF